MLNHPIATAAVLSLAAYAIGAAAVLWCWR